VARAAAILRALAEEHPDGSLPADGLPLAVIAKTTGLSPSTTHRLLRALTGEHLVEQDASTERYRLGPFAGVLGQGYLASAGLERAVPILRSLCRQTDESVSLATLHGTTALVVLQEHSPQPLRVDHLAGKELFLHASAMGKVLLAFSSLGIVDAAASLGELSRFTPRTITTRQALVRELEAVRTRGYATNEGERYDGANGVAVPVLSPASSSTNFALGIQGPATRLTAERTAELADICRRAAVDIAALGIH
jgi:IclR family acetate operon transcriptional repressor